MVYDIEEREASRIVTEIQELFKGVKVSIKCSRSTPGGFGDLAIAYSSAEESEFGSDAGSFNLCSVPNNCGLAWMGGVTVSPKKKKSLKFEILEIISKHMSHSGIFLSQVDSSGWRTDYWKVYEKYGFKPILQDRGVVHGNNNDLRLYYKPLNEKAKVKRGGPSWKTPLGIIDSKDLKPFDQK